MRVLGEVGSALDHAHSQGFLHRDVKPANVLLDEAGRTYLSDFGISKAIEGSISLTRTAGLVGTPAYMAPEQVGGQQVDARADVYALGVVAYQMFTDRLPFSGAKPREQPGADPVTLTANASLGARTVTLASTPVAKDGRADASSWKRERAEDPQRLWAALRGWIAARRPDVRVGVGSLNWVRVDVGVDGFRPTVSHSFDKLTLAVNLMFGPDLERERFTAALAAGDELERALGVRLEWAVPDASKPWATALFALADKTLEGDGFPWVLAMLTAARPAMASVFARAGL